MGACDYQTTSHGKTLQDAYRNAREDARAYNGHREGYSGDIQTSSGVREFTVPQGLSAAKLLHYAELLQQAEWAQRRADEAAEDARRWPQAAMRYSNAQQRALAERNKLTKQVPPKHAAVARAIAWAIDVKCGPAAALEVTGKAAVEYKRKHGLARTRNRVWIFAGTAAC